MSGNVTALVLGGNLIVTGDVTTHAIAITASSVAGKQYDIIGFDNNTTVNNQPLVGGLSVASVSNVTGAVLINLPGGNNTVLLGGGAGTFWTSAPANTPVEFPSRVAITTGSGGDEIGLENVTAAKDIVISTGAGADRVGMDAVTATAGQVLVTTGAGADIVALLNTAATGAVLSTGADADSVFIRDTAISGQLAVSLSSGDDSLLISDDLTGANFGLTNFDIPKSGPVNLGMGFFGATAGYLLIDTNSGTNDVTLRTVNAGILALTTGPDINTVSVTDVTIAQYTLLVGGPGTNTLTMAGTNSFGSLVKIRFTP
jgi:hypothetical protein